MIVLVCGGRDYTDQKRVFAVLDEIKATRAGEPMLLIHGDAPGADSLAKRWTEVRGVDTVVFPANWVGRGKPAGPYRNRMMMRFVRICEHKRKLVVAFPGGTGTADMVGLAKDAAGVDLIEVRPAQPLE